MISVVLQQLCTLLPKAGMDDSVNKYVKEKIEGSVLVTDPFPFVYIENIFPEDFYNKVDAIFPSIEQTTHINDKSYQTLNHHVVGRHTLSIYSRMNQYQDIENYPYKDECINLRRWLFGYLTPLLAKKLRVDLLPGKCDDDTRFVIDQEGYFKHPHTDISQKLMSILIYMSHSRQGTTILRPKQEGFRDDFGYDHSYEKFEEAFNPPFVPNALIAFPRTDTSFHCVKKLGPDEYRRSIHINIRR